jgi:AcrR family transcriptional regulator
LERREAKPSAKPAGRTNDPERTKADIVAVATKEFSEHGYSGGRVDEIAERTQTSKRMIYYYFGSKDGLYRAVLMQYYANLRGAEQKLHLEDLAPLEALERLVHFTVDYHIANADDVRLVMVENIHRGRHIHELPSIEPLNSSLVALIGRICDCGVAEGVIRPGLDPMDVYMSIAALSYFNVSNRHTFSTIFGVDMTSKAFIAARRKSITETILRSVATDPNAI